MKRRIQRYLLMAPIAMLSNCSAELTGLPSRAQRQPR
jgi:hypothetical protein